MPKTGRTPDWLLGGKLDTSAHLEHAVVRKGRDENYRATIPIHGRDTVQWLSQEPKSRKCLGERIARGQILVSPLDASDPAPLATIKTLANSSELTDADLSELAVLRTKYVVMAVEKGERITIPPPIFAELELVGKTTPVIWFAFIGGRLEIWSSDSKDAWLHAHSEF